MDRGIKRRTRGAAMRVAAHARSLGGRGENLTELQGPDEMISRPQLLEAGKPYAFKLVHESPTSAPPPRPHPIRGRLALSVLSRGA